MKSPEPDREHRISIVPVADVPPVTRPGRASALLPFLKIIRELAPGKALRIGAADRKAAHRLRHGLYGLTHRAGMKARFRICDDALFVWREGAAK